MYFDKNSAQLSHELRDILESYSFDSAPRSREIEIEAIHDVVIVTCDAPKHEFKVSMNMNLQLTNIDLPDDFSISPDLVEATAKPLSDAINELANLVRNAL